MIPALVLFAIAYILFSGRGGRKTTRTGRGGGQVSGRQMRKAMRRGMGLGPSWATRMLRRLIGTVVALVVLGGAAAYVVLDAEHRLPADLTHIASVPAAVNGQGGKGTAKHTTTGTKPTAKAAPAATATGACK